MDARETELHREVPPPRRYLLRPRPIGGHGVQQGPVVHDMLAGEGEALLQVCVAWCCGRRLHVEPGAAPLGADLVDVGPQDAAAHGPSEGLVVPEVVTGVRGVGVAAEGVVELELLDVKQLHHLLDASSRLLLGDAVVHGQEAILPSQWRRRETFARPQHVSTCKDPPHQRGAEGPRPRHRGAPPSRARALARSLACWALAACEGAEGP
mmetsp:Transcript_146713/g.470818  ORF Transcript_146713/g.470818 Transcript_146713/m.470818 type:complete len:209 (-) Transcript_146713:17-643(-)